MDFVEETGVDGDGLRREFWSLLFKDIKRSLFEGCGDRMVPRHDFVALQVREGVGY